MRPTDLATPDATTSSAAASAQEPRHVANASPVSREFEQALRACGLWPLRPVGIEVLQLNVGKRCNQVCRHCHVDAGPDRTEVMSREIMQHCVRVLAETDIGTVDVTGGAPELNPDFRWLIEQVSGLGRHVIDRCNLTVLHLPQQEDLPSFLARHRVEVACSLPHYRPLNTDRQRGEGVFEQSVEGLRKLNAVGYGDGQSGLRLVLVSNPGGAFLPGDQAAMEREWKREMERLYGIRFDALLTITNVPVARFRRWLQASGNLESYVSKLEASFNPRAAANVMCRHTLSVSWDGYLYDCDFNQMLDLPVSATCAQQIADFDRALLEGRDIRVGRHCFGCTAGSGSSCGGATA